MNKLVIGAAAIAAAAVYAIYSGPNIMFGPPGGKTLTAAEKSSCGITAQVTEGPYFVTGTAALADNNLDFTKSGGTPIAVSGHVFEGLDNTKPVANAKIELWQTDDAGAYHPNNNGPLINYKPEEIALRGFVTSNDKGEYNFTSIYPGTYSGRTRHIHVKVTAPGKEAITTQLIIQSKPDDPLTFDSDTVSQGLPTCHLIKFDETQTPQRAIFDFRL